MKAPPAWSSIETDIRTVMALAVDVCRNMVGQRHPSGRGDAAAAALLGMETLHGVDGFIVEEIYHSFTRRPNRKFLAKIDIERTLFSDAARRCYDLVANKGPIEHIRYDDDRDDGLNWLRYFLSAIPDDSYGTGAFDYSDLKHNPDSNLRLLHDMTSAQLTLAEYVDDLTKADASWEEWRSTCVFTARDISLLGDVNIRTVRNVMGPNGNKPIRTETIDGKASRRPNLVWGNALDSIEWLAGRRGFQPGSLSPQWVDGRISAIGSLPALAAVPGVVAWINRTTTDELAAKLQWLPERVRSWTRGKDIYPEQAEAISAAAGLDGKAYASRIKSLLG